MKSLTDAFPIQIIQYSNIIPVYTLLFMFYFTICFEIRFGAFKRIGEFKKYLHSSVFFKESLKAEFLRLINVSKFEKRYFEHVPTIFKIFIKLIRICIFTLIFFYVFRNNQ